MKVNKATLSILIVLAIVVSCDRDEFKPIYNVPDEFQPFVESFIAEAAIRGHDIEIKNLVIEFDPNLGSVHCGKCNSNKLGEDIQKVISINSITKCWVFTEEYEALVFHELGHCILGRLHNSELLSSGDPKSIMVPNDVSLYSPCLYPIGNDPCDYRYRRSYYLDELFNENTPVPDWGE